MHRRNLDLRAKNLEALDVNEINGINIDILKSVLEIGATYDEAARFNNNSARQDKTFNNERRRQLINDIDRLEKEKLELTRVIAALKREKETADSEDEKKIIEAQILEKTEIKAEVDSQIESKRTELNSLSSAGTTLANTTGGATFDPDKFPPGMMDAEIKDQIKKALEGLGANPKLNASLQLDKFLQLQYEIISKQLTLLRDEVGPGERLLFLELPQSINANYDKSDDMWAQSRWKISGFTGCMLKLNSGLIPCNKLLNFDGTPRNEEDKNRQPRSTLEIYESVTSAENITDKFEITRFDITDREKFINKFKNKTDDSTLSAFFNDSAEYESMRNLNGQQLIDAVLKILNDKIGLKESEAVRLSQLNRDSSLRKTATSGRTSFLERFTGKDTQTIRLLNRLWIEDELFPDSLRKLREEDFASEYHSLKNDKKIGDLTVDNRLVRTVEIIPRQSSFNVNDIKVRNKSSALNFVVSTLFGLGGSFNYQQQRERYSQFVQQELYSSGFGKGSREFGWTFTSMPGTDRLLSGTRNTYAVVIIPQEATSIAVQSIGCSFDRTYKQPENFDAAVEMKSNEKNKSKNNCGAEKSFVIPIPGGGFDSNNDFYVSGLTYQPVENGKRIVVSIYGSNFSSQIGLMVNGIALPAAIGLAQNFIVDDSSVAKSVTPLLAQEKVKGSFERVDSNQIIASFSMEDFRDGTPVITLISPGKAIDLNTLGLYINGERNVKLSDEPNRNVKWMFGKKPISDFKINDVQIFVSGVNKEKNNEVTQLTALISGKALFPVTDAYVNGNKLDVDGSCQSNNKLLNRIDCFGAVGTTRNNVLQLIFNPPDDEKIHIVLISDSDVFKLDPISNPAKGKKPKDPPSLSADLSFTY